MRSIIITFISAAVILIPALILDQQQAQAFDLNDLKQLEKIGKSIKKTQKIDSKQEVKIGRDLAAGLLGAAPLVDDAELQTYVNKVGRWVAAHAGRDELPWTFGVLDHDHVNSFATPGGFIFITRGLLEQMDTETELAGVLAHEIMHVIRKHHLKAIQQEGKDELLTELLVAASDKDQKENARKLLSAGKELYTRGLNKDDEFEADRRGIVLATKAGYDPFGLVSVIQKLETLGAKDTRLALMFKTHPSPTDRLKYLGKAMGNRLDAYANQPALAERLQAHSH